MAAECWDVFIRYKSEDLAIAEELHRRLEAAAFSVWFDRARLQTRPPDKVQSTGARRGRGGWDHYGWGV